MLELQDIQKLFEVLPSKTDFNELRSDFNELRKEVSEIKMTLNNLVTISDGLVGRMEMLHQEYL
jgi:stage III sporulation protein SpoIIIAA